MRNVNAVANQSKIINKVLSQKQPSLILNEIGKAMATFQFEADWEQPLDHYEDKIHHALLAHVNDDPASYAEAMNSKERAFWQLAIDEELKSMRENTVWELVDKPLYCKDGKKPNIIDSKWVFKRKIDANGKVKHKARLVIRGFKDRNIYDLRETYAPVSRISLVRTLFAIANKHDLEMAQLDVKTAFLNGKIQNEEIYMEIPEGTSYPKGMKELKVCKLLRALYGLRISPKLRSS